jgi:shikimate dehydrogenase
MNRFSGGARVAGVLGRPVAHSLSPLIHNAWIEAAGLDAVYVPLSPEPGRLRGLFDACRGGLVAGFNVTVPYKQEALAAADAVTGRARRAGAANLVLFAPDGSIAVDSTDGEGLLAALAAQAPVFSPRGSVAAVLGAGGAGRSAVAALLEAGATEVRLLNRTPGRAAEVAEALGERVSVFAWAETAAALEGAGLLVNATTLGLEGGEPLVLDLDPMPADSVVLDMVYRPLTTPLLADAAASGRTAVDGLAMLIGQARPSFAALFGRPPPADVDVRALALNALGGDG